MLIPSASAKPVSWAVEVVSADLHYIFQPGTGELVITYSALGVLGAGPV
jgi:hypothetical protein